MEDEIREYVNYKWMVSSIYRENGFIEKHCEEDFEFEYLFFHDNNLTYLIEVLQGGLEYQCFDESKLNNIASAMKYFINKYKDNDDKKNTIDYCNMILKLAKHPKGKSIKYFYMDQYSVRNQCECKKITPDIKSEINKQVIVDVHYLKCLLELDVDKQFPVNDIEFIKSVNIFIKDCPSIICEKGMNWYVRSIVEKNMTCEEYNKNTEFKRLNDSLFEYLEEIKETGEKLKNQILGQTIFSLIFSQDIRKTLSDIRKEPTKDEFFGQTQFDILCEFIMNNKETCMFDFNARENMREILYAFVSENKHLNMKYSLNELKISLNIIESEEFKQKNIQFYKNVGNEYRQPMIQYDDAYVRAYKHMINLLINSTSNFVVTIVEDTMDYTWGAENAYTPCYINFIINNYPLIRENPIYLQRIQDLLYANALCLESTKQYALQIENHKMQKKVKKLCK